MISIGKVVKTQGNKGDLRVLPYLNYPEHFKELDFVFIKDKKLKVLNIKSHKQFIILKLEGCDSIDRGREFIDYSIKIPKDKLKTLPSDQFYWHDIEGLTVFDEDGHLYGKIEEIIPTGSNDIFVVRNKDKETLIPAIKDVIKDINLAKKKVIIHLINGLID
ncbi:MAG TPA: ribosome maturation factor RimM [Nitrospinota bacterium]|nr:ribosome maturation factor RimM [Nitrospinota bacterium]